MKLVLIWLLLWPVCNGVSNLLYAMVRGKYFLEPLSEGRVGWAAFFSTVVWIAGTVFFTFNKNKT